MYHSQFNAAVTVRLPRVQLFQRHSDYLLCARITFAGFGSYWRTYTIDCCFFRGKSHRSRIRFMCRYCTHLLMHSDCISWTFLGTIWHEHFLTLCQKRTEGNKSSSQLCICDILLILGILMSKDAISVRTQHQLILDHHEFCHWGKLAVMELIILAFHSSIVDNTSTLKWQNFSGQGYD